VREPEVGSALSAEVDRDNRARPPPARTSLGRL